MTKKAGKISIITASVFGSAVVAGSTAFAIQYKLRHQSSSKAKNIDVDNTDKIKQALDDIFNANKNPEVGDINNNTLKNPVLQDKLKQQIEDCLEQNGISQNDIDHINIGEIDSNGDIKITIQFSPNANLDEFKTNPDFKVVDDEVSVKVHVVPKNTVSIELSKDQMDQLEKDLNNFINSHQSDLNNPDKQLI